MSLGRMVLLLDVDNTLLDNDAVKAGLELGIRETVGPERALRFWELYEEVRADLDLVDLPETLERFARECEDLSCLGPLAEVVYGFDFAGSVFPGALAAVAHARSLGLPVILSDGDQLFQRHKIRSAGLEAAFEGRVLVYQHKEQETADIRARYPAEHYVMLDDKPRIHAAMKAILGEAVTTILIEHGTYALDPLPDLAAPPDLRLPSIEAFSELSAEQLRAAAVARD